MADNNDALMAYAMGQDNGRNSGGGWGGFGDGWMGLLAFAMIFGWGNGGWGGGFGGGSGGGAYPVEAILQRSLDTQTIIGKLDGLSNGVCDSTFALSGAMNNGFAQAELSRCNQQANLMQQLNSMALAHQNCCCENRQMIADLKYDMATSDCSIKTLVNQLAQQIMWGQQNGLRDLSDLINNKFCQLAMEQKDAVIADLRTQLAQCGDQNMANAIVARLTAVINPPAVPAYPAANPNGFGNWAPQVLNGGGWNNCGCNQGCGSCC